MPIDITPVVDLAHDLSTQAGKIGGTVAVVVRKTAFDIETDAKSLAAVDTGYMRSTIGVDTTVTPTTATAVIGPTANYAPFVELGTSRMAPQPFMGPATDKRLPGYFSALGKI